MAWRRILLPALALALGLIGCGAEAPTPASPTPEWAAARNGGAKTTADRTASPAALEEIVASGRHFKIVMIPAADGSFAGQQIADGFKADAARLGVSAQVVTPAGGVRQADALKAAIAAGANAVCIIPQPGQDLRNALQAARERHVPVVSVQDFASSPVGAAQSESPSSGSVGVDANTAGRLAGQALLPLWGRARVGVLADPSAGLARSKGFGAAVSGALAVVPAQMVRADGSDAEQRTADLLRRFPNLGALFCATERAAPGAIAAVAAAGLKKQIAIVAYGVNPELISLLSAGGLVATVDPHSNRVGRYAIRMAVGLLENRFDPGAEVIAEQDIRKR